MTLMTLSEVREHVESDLPDAALQRLINAADSTIVRHAGGHAGLEFRSILLQTRVTSDGTDLWPSAARVVGNPFISSTVRIDSVGWESVGTSELLGRVVMRSVQTSDTGDDLSEIFSGSGAADEKSLYVVLSDRHAEIPFDLIDDDLTDGDAVTWELPGDGSYAAEGMVMDDVLDDDLTWRCLVADDHVIEPYQEAEIADVRREVLIGLVKLEVQYNGLMGSSVGDYSETSVDYGKERAYLLGKLNYERGRAGVLA